MATRARAPIKSLHRPACTRPARRHVAVKAEGGFDIDKFVDDLPVPVEYAYAGVAWGAAALLLFWEIQIDRLHHKYFAGC
jgi:hypothetical protein